MTLRAVMAFMALARASATALGGCSGKEELSTDLVVGRGGVSCGVASRGVPGPKAPIELGRKTAQPWGRATSSTR